jgi:hypothetical protein
MLKDLTPKKAFNASFVVGAGFTAGHMAGKVVLSLLLQALLG